ncbi:uncharacterized protein LOC135400439 [Ornithodoros turicata]|uniref:uncharacterized protein LOC135400439 n=1 Tax=Ornithodoros turicata TaxID=34597 RepID=UPI0031397D1C
MASSASSSSGRLSSKPPVMVGDGQYYAHPDDISAWTDDLRLWPNTTSGDIVYYLVNSKACDLQDVKAYKSLESYNYLQCGWVGKLLAHKINNDAVYVQGDVRPSQAVNNKPHKAWICARYSGEVVTAGCTCMAGRARVCSHVGAVLWKIDLAVCRGLTGSSCTDTAMQWNQGTKRNVEPAVLQDITFRVQKRTVDSEVKQDRSKDARNSHPKGEKAFQDFLKSSPFSFLFNIKGTLLYDTIHASSREQEESSSSKARPSPAREENKDESEQDHSSHDD